MSLTTEQVQQLTATFEAQEHEFLRGFIYITEGAITNRLDSVDENWTFEVLNITQRGDQIIAHCRLQVCGVYRDNVGMAKPMLKTEKETGAVVEVNEPEKSAVTDALKRCSRLFGIGRYLLNLPDNVKDQGSLQKWLQMPQNAPNPRAAQLTATQSSQTPQNAPDGVVDTIPYVAPGDKQYWPVFWTYAHPLFEAAGYQQKHRSASVGKLTQEGKINIATMPVALAIEVVRKHLAEKGAS